MIIHFSILGIIIIVSLLWEGRIKRNNIRAIYDGGISSTYISSLTPWIIVFGYIAFLAAMRTKYNDTYVYINSFENLPGTWEAAISVLTGNGKDKGFDFLGNIFKCFISEDYHMWFLAFAIVEAIILARVMRRETVSLWDACFYFFVSTLYVNNFSMMRQWFAVVVLFGASKFIKQKRFISFLIICLLAAQIHNSAYLMIVVYFLVQGKPWSRKQNIMIFAFAIAMLLLNPLLETTSDLLQDTTYDYVVNTMQTGNGSSPVRILISAVPVLIAFIYRKRINEADDMINLCVNMSLINLLLNMVATFTSGLYVIRLSTYMNMYNVILYPYLLNVSVSKMNKKFIKVGFYVFFFLLYIYQMKHQGEWYYISDVLGVFI